MPVLKARIGGAWVNVGGAEEVAIQPADPGVAFDMWYDTDAPTPAGTQEVIIGPTDPGPGYDLWYDTGAPTTLGLIVERATYTPTYNNMSVGTGGNVKNTATYTYVGSPGVGGVGILSVSGVWKLGSSGVSVGSFPNINLPPGFQFVGFTAGNYIGGCRAVDTSAGAPYGGMIYMEAIDKVTLFSIKANTTTGFIFEQYWGSTNPFTWAVDDEVAYTYTASVVKV